MGDRERVGDTETGHPVWGHRRPRRLDLWRREDLLDAHAFHAVPKSEGTASSRGRRPHPPSGRRRTQVAAARPVASPVGNASSPGGPRRGRKRSVPAMCPAVASVRFVGAISSPSGRHDGYSRGCRNQDSSLRELMTKSRLSPVDEPADAWGSRYASCLLRSQKVASARDAAPRRRWPRMALASGDALVEATDMAVRVAAAHQTDRFRGFDEGPLEVAVDVGAEAPVAQLVPARVDAASAPSVAGELLGDGKPGDGRRCARKSRCQASGASPRMRGAPQRGFAAAILLTRTAISASTGGRPRVGRRESRVQ
jgi:hypothetical protein